MPQPISIQNARIIDNFYLWEAFQGINNSRVYSDFRISDNFYLYTVILANIGSGMVIKGDIDCSTDPNYPAASSGDVWRVSVAGKIGGAAGKLVSQDNLLVCIVAAAAGTQAAVGSSWAITQVGLQRIFEVDFATGDVTQAMLRDWTGTIARNVSLTATGTFALAGTNFQVLADGHVRAGVSTGSDLAIGWESQTNALGNNSGTSVGYRALRVNAGQQNSAFGSDSARITTTANNNSSFGWKSLETTTTGSQNTALGSQSLRNNVTGQHNTAVGYLSLVNVMGDYNTGVGTGAIGGAGPVTGTENVAMGATALNALTSGSFNVSIGDDAMNLLTTGSNNTAVGLQSGKNITTTSGGVFLGYKAGFFETGANKLFIDNQQRTNEADGRIKALIYGIFDAATANQFLTANAHLLIREDLQFTTKAIDVVSGDSATINSPAGRFRKDNSGAAFTLTNSYITANSIILLTPANAAVDATGVNWTVIAGAGSAVITWAAAPTADFDMNFLVIN